MHVNRSSVLINTQPARVDRAYSDSGLSTSESSAPSRANLKNRVTSRTMDYLQRFRAHGSTMQQSIATAAGDALSNDFFLANPAREVPVIQFGVSMTLNGNKGILLANFMLHGDQLELEALAFRAEKFFETEAGSIEKIILKHAKELPEFIAGDHSTGSAASEKLRELKQRSQGDVLAEQRLLQKEIERFDKQSMHRQMASKHADERIKDGRSKSRLTALPVAHVTLVGAQLQKLITVPFNKIAGKTRVLKSQQLPVPKDTLSSTVPVTPRGLQYQFSNQDFAKFYDEHWLPAHDTNSVEHSEITRLPSSEQAMDAREIDFTARRDRRNGRFIDDNIKTELQSRLDQDLLSSPPIGEEFIDDEAIQSFFQHIESTKDRHDL
jgi:hypothetical protein